MAARTRRITHDDKTRAKIKASQLINRLTEHALSDEPIMDASQVRAALGLVDKVVANLQSIELQVEGEVATVTRTPLSVGDWQKKADEAQEIQGELLH